MSQPVKLSNALVLDARLTAEPFQRSIAGQVEYWARLGRCVDLLLEGHEVLRLMQSKTVKPLSECLASVDTPEGREKVFSYLRSQPYPHFEAIPSSPRLFVRIEADGSRTTGRFSGRNFVPVDENPQGTE